MAGLLANSHNLQDLGFYIYKARPEPADLVRGPLTQPQYLTIERSGYRPLL